MRLCGEVVNFVRFDVCEDIGEGDGVGHIAVVKGDFPLFGNRAVEMFQIFSVEKDGISSDHSVNVIPLSKQKLRQKRSVLARNAGY